jgi:hypothetical protein
MDTHVTASCCDPTAGRLEHVNFFNRQLLTAEDMTAEQNYFLEKLRRHNRFMHGTGVVCGLAVTAAPFRGAPWRVEISPGYALGPYGDEIFVGEPVYFDLAACLTGGATNPCEPGLITPGTSTTAYLAIQYADCLARPVQTAFSGCGCDDDPCQYSRVRDGFQLKCLAQLPPAPPPPVNLCQTVAGAIAPCPPCPTSPWLVLAQITLPTASTMNITNANVDTSIRPVILSTAVLQAQIVACCCGPTGSSSSSSSSSAIFRQQILRAGHGAVLSVAQRATRLIGKNGAVQFTVTVVNSGAQTAEHVVVAADITPLLPAAEFALTLGAGLIKTAAQNLKSEAITLPPGKNHVFSFEIAPVGTATAQVTVTAAATAANPGAGHAATPIHAQIGGSDSSSSTAAAAAAAAVATPVAAPVLKSAPPAAVLNLTQAATAAGAATRFTVTALNTGAAPAEAVAIVVDLSPALKTGAYQLTSGPAWEAASLMQLRSAPVTLAPGKAQTVSFDITPAKGAPPVKLTATASASGAAPGLTGTASPLEISIGG